MVDRLANGNSVTVLDKFSLNQQKIFDGNKQMEKGPPLLTNGNQINV